MLILSLFLAALTSAPKEPLTIITTRSSPECTLLRDSVGPALKSIAQTHSQFVVTDGRLLNAAADAVNQNYDKVALDVAQMDAAAMHLAKNIRVIQTLLADKRYHELSNGNNHLSAIREHLQKVLAGEEQALNDITALTESWHAAALANAGIPIHGVTFTLPQKTLGVEVELPNGYQAPGGDAMMSFAKSSPWFSAAANITYDQSVTHPDASSAARLIAAAAHHCSGTLPPK